MRPQRTLRAGSRFQLAPGLTLDPRLELAQPSMTLVSQGMTAEGQLSRRKRSLRQWTLRDALIICIRHRTGYTDQKSRDLYSQARLTLMHLARESELPDHVAAQAVKLPESYYDLWPGQ